MGSVDRVQGSVIGRVQLFAAVLVATASATLAAPFEVSGCTSGQVLVVVASNQDAAADLELVRAQLATATQTALEGQHVLRTLGWTAEREATLASAEAGIAVAKQALATAQAAYDEAFLEAITEQVGADNALLAQRATANAHRNAPDHYKVLELSEDGWKALESALAHEAEAAEEGQQPTLTDAEAAALSAANANSEVQLRTAVPRGQTAGITGEDPAPVLHEGDDGPPARGRSWPTGRDDLAALAPVKLGICWNPGDAGASCMG